jgi:hypothetical protein
LAKIRPQKKSLVREPWFNVAPKTVLGGEPWFKGLPKKVWAVFDFYKIKKITGQRAAVQCGAQNSFGGEPRFKGLPKTVLVESRGSRGCPKQFW